jgi:hypothetical protein
MPLIIVWILAGIVAVTLIGFALNFLFRINVFDVFHKRPVDKPDPRATIGEVTPIPPLDIEIDQAYITQQGTKEAGAAGGKWAAYVIALNRFYASYIMKIIEDMDKINEWKNRINKQISEIFADKTHKNQLIENNDKQIDYENEKISDFKKEINVLEQKKMDVNTHPNKYGMNINPFDKVKFFIFLIVLIPIVLYLYIFYNSVFYSVSFKNFIEGMLQTGVADAYFDPNALSNSFKLGFSGFIITLLFPFVFYIPPLLSYMINANKTASHKKIKLFALIFGTLVLDAALAYMITKKMYGAIREDSPNPESIPLYDISIAITTPDFWLIVGIGFGVCICCGFLFDFFMDTWEKLHPLSLILKGIDNDIKLNDKKIGEIKVEIEKMENENKLLKQGIVNDTNVIQKLQASLNDNPVSQIPLAQLKLIVYSFLGGWNNFVNSINGSQEDKEQPAIITEKFFNDIALSQSGTKNKLIQG